MATGLAWNAGAELLAPMTFGGMHLVRKFLGLEGDYAKQIKRIAEQWWELAYLEMADPNSVGGRVIKTFTKVFGQLPFVGTPALALRLKDINNLHRLLKKILIYNLTCT